MGLDNENPTVYSVSKDAYGQSARSRLWRMSQNSELSETEAETQTESEAIDAGEVFDLIRNINDPEHPVECVTLTLEQLHVAQLRHITVDHENSRISVVFTPTIPHCSMATLIGLCIRVQLLRCLPARFKVDINVEEGTHQSEKSVNKQLNESNTDSKERVAAAMENSHLVEVVNQCLATTIDKIAATTLNKLSKNILETRRHHCSKMESTGLRQRRPSLKSEVTETHTQTPDSDRSNASSPTSDISNTDSGVITSKSKYIQRRSHSNHRHASKKGKFTERSSQLDFGTLERDKNPMRGFFVLFWVSMGWYTISTAWETFVRVGVPFDMSLAFQMTERGAELATSDSLMILSCFMVIPLVKLVQYRIVPVSAAPVMNWIWLGLWFSTVVSWALFNNWGWTQSGAFTIHCIAMLMKQASYLMSNLESIWKTQELPHLQADIDLLRAEQEGDSSRHQEQLELLLSEQAQFKLDLKGKVTGLEFPRNLTFFNFVNYMAFPTLVYEIEYPRTKSFRPMYFLEKVLGTFGIFFLLVSIVSHNINPVLEMSGEIDFITSIM
ncbi:hypothetical protein HDU80_006627, partial [Chytriomyces hyalinus]